MMIKLKKAIDTNQLKLLVFLRPIVLFLQPVKYLTKKLIEKDRNKIDLSIKDKNC